MKTWGKRIGVSVLSLVAVCVIAIFAVDAHVRNSTASRILSVPEAAALSDVDCVLVLGCGVNPDGQPSPMLADRITQGINLYKDGAAPKLLMSGDHGQEGYDEVNVMKAVALEAGVPASDVFMDHAGFSTYESMYRARDVFGAKRVIIVTQQYHLYRALYVANALGLEAYGVSADLRPYANQAPRDQREVLARGKDFVTSILQPAPTYLGDPIPLSGNGEATNG